MNESSAWRFFVAAEDNAVLAAWAHVCHEHHVITATDISPYDAWDTFHDFLNHGVVSHATFNSVGGSSQFFRSVPSSSDIQSVLDRIRFLCPEHTSQSKETDMSDSNPFFPNSESLAKRDKPAELRLATHEVSGPFGELSTQAPTPMGAFGEKEIPTLEGSMLEAFSQSAPNAAALPCRDPKGGNQSEVISVGGESYKPDVRCGRCGEQLNMTDEGSEILPEDGEDSANSTLLIAIFRAKCDACGLMHHCTVADDPYPAQY